MENIQFSAVTQPRVQIKKVTNCERIQPTCCAVTDERGELVWEGREMPRWQMEMFKVFVDWAGARIARWGEVFHLQDEDREFRPGDSLVPDDVKAMSKEGIEARKRMYRQGKKWRTAVQGD